MRFRPALCLALIGVVIAPVAARAEIRLRDAQVTRGNLVVAGRTDLPHFMVVLDERYSVTADSRGRFAFRIVYIPPDCIGTLRAGTETLRFAVANCGPAGPRGEQGARGESGPPGPPGISGPAGPQGAPGVIGPAGPQGAKGDQGARGSQGSRGDRGPRGDAGPRGPQGDSDAPDEWVR